MKKVIWIVWALAAGKDSAAELVSEILNIPILQISWELKEIAKKRGISIERENLIKLSRELSKEYSDWYLAQRIYEKNNSDVLLIAWMRQLWQLEYLKKNTDFLLIWIDASPVIRYNRMKSRAKFWDPITLEEFIEIEKKENETWVQKTDKCISMSDYLVKNEESEDDLKNELIKVLKKEKII